MNFPCKSQIRPCYILNQGQPRIIIQHKLSRARISTAHLVKVKFFEDLLPYMGMVAMGHVT